MPHQRQSYGLIGLVASHHLSTSRGLVRSLSLHISNVSKDFENSAEVAYRCCCCCCYCCTRACKRRQPTLVPPPPLTISGVLAALRGIVAQAGPGSAARRQAAEAGLLRCCRDVELKYLVRSPQTELAVGASWDGPGGPWPRQHCCTGGCLADGSWLPSTQGRSVVEQQQQQQQQQHPAATPTSDS